MSGGDLAQRIRSALAGHAVTEQKMFGGVCFMLNGNMAAGTLKNELLVRVGADGHAAALARPGARAMERGGKPMLGYIIVDEAGTAADRDLRAWLDLAVAHVRQLPAKAPKAR